eukprot:CAMPEP_0197925572 /NCGR_PEP_ID=MMETSP1439-20131203/97663_1 /TAXON_ID=66791 /ORGANISM="Gonyaulax spinifera, Strain CCMP409" /LENGTH=139 /DNA_ID=CAMNT_0043548055 /DNA_START=14 /DNA_END=429 /DNA_ORIENTATION=+
MMLWAPEMVKNKETMESIAASLEDTYQPGGLEPLPDDFRRQGGDRMLKFGGLLGMGFSDGPNEDHLCLRVRESNFGDLPTLPPEPPFDRHFPFSLPELPGPSAEALENNPILDRLPALRGQESQPAEVQDPHAAGSQLR